MTLQSWWIFVCANFLISAMPGPNMLHVMTQAMRQGIARAMFAMAGCMLGLFFLFGLSAMGMSALLAALPELLTAIKIVGALYLLWIGSRRGATTVPRSTLARVKPARGASALASCSAPVS